MAYLCKHPNDDYCTSILLKKLSPLIGRKTSNYYSYKVDKEDLQQEIRLSILECIKKNKPYYGNKFGFFKFLNRKIGWEISTYLKKTINPEFPFNGIDEGERIKNCLFCDFTFETRGQFIEHIKTCQREHYKPIDHFLSTVSATKHIKKCKRTLGRLDGKCTRCNELKLGAPPDYGDAPRKSLVKEYSFLKKININKLVVH